MDNKINKIINLEDNYKVFVVNQAIYNNQSYYLTVGIDPITLQFNDEFAVYTELVEDGKPLLKVVKDQTLLDLLLKYLNPNNGKE